MHKEGAEMICIEKCPVAKELVRTNRDVESLVWLALNAKDPIITISRGREILGFKTMEEMREWMNKYEEEHK